MISIAYLELDIRVSLSLPPWKYYMGDIQANLETLKVDDNVTEPVSLKMRALLRLGFGSDVLAGCKLIQETSTTTIL